MTKRERIKKALAHQEPDRVPFDLNGSIVTSVAIPAYERLVEALGLPERPIRVQNVYSQTAFIDDDVLQVLEVDTRPTVLNDPENWKLEYIEKDGQRFYTDEWHITYAMNLDGTSGYTVVNNPLREANRIQDIEKYSWPDTAHPSRFTNLREQSRRLAEEEEVGVILETNIGGIFEWPAWLRGMENFLSDLAGNPPMAEAMIDKLTDLKVSFWEAALSTTGEYVDLVRESDDLGGQAGLLISPKMYRKYIKPAHRRICETIRKYTDAAICLHSCGSIWDLIPDIIDSGFDVLNPVQIGAARMDAAALKREFGRDLVFWGGSVDSQKVLPFASPEQVLDQARQSLEAFAPGGGYIFAPINMINADVPPQNILALAEAVRLYGNY
jgi:uroporphyrinogen decarboxylase